MAAAAAAAMAAGLNPAAAAAVLGAQGQQAPSPITAQKVSANPTLALKATAGSNSISSPISPPFPAGMFALPAQDLTSGASKGGRGTLSTSPTTVGVNLALKSTHQSSTASSVSSSSSAGTLADPTSTESSEAERLRSEMSALQNQLEALRRHLQNMDNIQSRAMSHVMQVLSTKACHDCPLSTVTELQDCLDTWRSMSEMAASLFPVEDCQKGSDDETVPEGDFATCHWGEEQPNGLLMDPGVEPTMLLLHGASLIDAPAISPADDYDLSLDDAATVSGDDIERPAKRRKSE